MAIFSREGGRLIRLSDYEKLWIEPWGKDSLRVRATCQAEMPLEDWALIAPESGEAEISNRWPDGVDHEWQDHGEDRGRRLRQLF